MTNLMVFKPRPSNGWLWMAGLAVLMLVLTVGPVVPVVATGEGPLWAVALPLVIGVELGGLFLVAAV